MGMSLLDSQCIGIYKAGLNINKPKSIQICAKYSYFTEESRGFYIVFSIFTKVHRIKTIDCVVSSKMFS